MRAQYVAIEKEMHKLMNFIALLYGKWEKNKDVRVYQESYQEGITYHLLLTLMIIRLKQLNTMERHTKMTEKIFIEIGFDLDNNQFGFGRSIEIEFTDGTEERFKFADRSVSKSLKVKSHYLRIWLGKKVLVIDSANPHFAFKKKNRNNFKFIIGKYGEKND